MALKPAYRGRVYRVELVYFRQTGKYLTRSETVIALEAIEEIWLEIDEMRRLGRLPGLRPGAGRDLLIVVDVPDHPARTMRLVMPPFVGEDDVTPPHVSTEQMQALAEIARTTTRDVVKVDPEADTVVQDAEDVTPVDSKLPDP